MIRPLIVVTLALFPSLASAQAPRLTFEEGGVRKPLHIDQASAEIFLTGNVAETTLTLRFKNHTGRMLEGEFVMPLPAGATVSSYALEVNGALRESVSVEKARARYAYETIKSKMIDPGLVEREEGNVYRTRVFPIPAKGTKEMRIGYVEPLVHRDGALHFQLPLNFPTAVGRFECVVERSGGGKIEIDAPEPLEFVSEGAGRFEAKAENKAIDGLLSVAWRTRIGQLRASSVSDESENRDYCLVSGVFPDDLPQERRELPGELDLIWDASDSARSMDSDKIFAVLDKWFATGKRTQVRLQLLRNAVTEAGSFDVVNGDWSKLRARLEKVVYDGATDFSELERSKGVRLMVTDGTAPYGGWDKHPLLVISSTDAAPLLRRAAAASGGVFVSLESTKPKAALAKLTGPAFSVDLARRDRLQHVEIDFDGQPGSVFRIVGTARWLPATLDIVLRSHTERREVQVRIEKVRANRQFIRRLWAQQHLLRLEAAGDGDKVVEFATRHGLVSDFTSLIVLERFEDYVTYRIPPPEADFKKRYFAAIEKKNIRREQQAGKDWREKMRWHLRGYPWADVALWSPLQRVMIWRRAMQKVFDTQELEGSGFERIDAWTSETLAVMERKDLLKTKDELDAWQREVAQLAARGSKLWNKGAPTREAGSTVSVQGLVSQPGKVSSDGPLSLRRAIELAGGPIAMGSIGHVSLYRQAGKITYNMYSRAYRPVLLRPGDMIVIGRPVSNYNDVVDDPFGTFETPAVDQRRDGPAVIEVDVPAVDWGGSLRDRPAVIEERPASGGFGLFPMTPGFSTASFPVTPANPTSYSRGGWRSSRAEEEPKQQPAGSKAVLAGTPKDEVEAPVAPKIERGAPGDMQAFRAALEKGNDALAAYANVKGGKARPRGFYVAAARELFQKGHDDLGRQVLSNLVEYRSGHTEIRTHALWLAEFGELRAAENLLSRLTSPEAAIDGARIRQRLGGAAGAARQLRMAIDHPDLVLLARTERNALAALHPDTIDRAAPVGDPADSWRSLPADVRIVLSSDRPDIRLVVVDPLGNKTGPRSGISQCGGRIVYRGYHGEYMMRRGLPGTYVVSCWAGHDDPFGLDTTRHEKNSEAPPATVQVGLFTNWGRPTQTARWVTVLVDGNLLAIGELDFELARPKGRSD